MEISKVFEALRLKVKYLKIVELQKSKFVYKNDIIDKVTEFSELIQAFKNTGNETDDEFRKNLVDMCAEIVIMVEQFQTNDGFKDLQKILDNIPKFPNGGLVYPSPRFPGQERVYGPNYGDVYCANDSTSKVLSDSDRTMIVSELEKKISGGRSGKTNNS